jgi:small subunit ribosomal protein S1
LSQPHGLTWQRPVKLKKRREVFSLKKAIVDQDVLELGVGVELPLDAAVGVEDVVETAPNIGPFLEMDIGQPVDGVGVESVDDNVPAAPKRRPRAKRQAVLPEGYVVEAGPWERLFQAKERAYTVAALIVAIDYPDGHPAWELTFRDYPGIRGIVPAGETDLPDQRLMQRFVGQSINVKIKGLDKENNLAACSRRDAVADARLRLYAEVQEGDMLECIVKAILPREDIEKRPERLLVDIGGGVLVEVNRSHAMLKLSQRLSQQYTPGQTVTARVTRVEPQKGIVEVSLKDGDAWDKVDYKRGQTISGTIVAVNGETCYIEPDATPGVMGIAPFPLRGEVRRGMRVSCKVNNFIRGTHKLRLRMLAKLA